MITKEDVLKEVQESILSNESKSFIQNIICLSDITADVSGEVSGEAEQAYKSMMKGAQAQVWHLEGALRYLLTAIDGSRDKSHIQAHHAYGNAKKWVVDGNMDNLSTAITPAPKVEVDWENIQNKIQYILDNSASPANSVTQYIMHHLRPSDKLDGVDKIVRFCKIAFSKIADWDKIKDDLDDSELGFTIEQYAAKSLSHIEYLQSTSPAPALQELGEEETDDVYDDEQICLTCSGDGGKHFPGCPEDDSPYGQLTRDGYC